MELSEAQKRFFKRARLDFQIVEHTSDKNSKFDLFQRLNSGTHLSEQEARNCLAVMLDVTFYRWLQELSGYPAFIAATNISERQEEEAYGIEIALRYLGMVTAERGDLSGLKDVGEFLTTRMRSFIASKEYNRAFEKDRFKNIFSWLNEALGDAAFKRYDHTRGAFSGRFTVSAFEAITTGIGLNFDSWKSVSPTDRSRLIVDRVKGVWKDPVFQSRTGAGKPASLRIPHMFEVGQRVFSLED